MICWRFVVLTGFLIVSLIPIHLYGQNTKIKIDSLKTILEQSTSDTSKVNVLVALATVESATADKIKYGNDAKQLAEKINWTEGIFKANNELGNIYFADKNDYATAAKYYQTNIAISQTRKKNDEEALSTENTAICYQNMGQHKKAIEYYDKSLSLRPGPDMEMGILGNMGDAYISIGDNPHALSSYISSLKLLENTLASKKTVDIKDTSQKAALLLNISGIYMQMGQPDKAAENYNQVINISRAIKNKWIEVLALNGIANTYKDRKDYAKAIETYTASLNESIDIHNFDGQVTSLNELANVYIETGDLGKAMECAKNALKLAEEHSRTGQLSGVYTTLGLVYLKQSEFQQAISFLEKALSLSQSNGELDIEQNALSALSDAYEKLNQPEKALKIYRDYIAVRDSVHGIDKANYLTRIDLEYTFDAEKQKQNAIFNEKIARQQVLTYCGYGGLALVLLLAFFIYKSYTTQKKYNALLSKEKQGHLAQISAQDTVLSDIAHTQSHFVRGPIATILGLLQFYNYEDPADPLNKEIIEGISVSIEKLDTVVKEVVHKENQLRRDTNT